MFQKWKLLSFGKNIIFFAYLILIKQYDIK